MGVLASFDVGPDLVLYFKYMLVLRGEKPDLLDAQIDIARVPEFNAKVYAIARAIWCASAMSMT